MGKVLVVLALVFGAWAWLQMVRTKEWAIAAAHRHCRDRGVQMLDGTVVLTGLRPVRTKRGTLGIQQRFRFEFTVTGERRYQGELVLIGRRLQKVELEPHRMVLDDPARDQRLH